MGTLLIILSALLSEGSAKLQRKRVLPGTLTELDKLVRQLTKEQVAAPNKASEVAEELMSLGGGLLRFQGKRVEEVEEGGLAEHKDVLPFFGYRGKRRRIEQD